jgi:hypothetical protein
VPYAVSLMSYEEFQMPSNRPWQGKLQRKQDRCFTVHMSYYLHFSLTLTSYTSCINTFV